MEFIPKEKFIYTRTTTLSLVVILIRIRLALAKPLEMASTIDIEFGILSSSTSSMMPDHQSELQVITWQGF